MKPEKTITKEIQHIGETEYTISINIATPAGFTIIEPEHENRLHISYLDADGNRDKQSHIIKENPTFPLGIPVRSKGENADVMVDYEFRFHRTGQPDDKYKTRVRYLLPVHIDKNEGDLVHLNETLPLEELV